MTMTISALFLLLGLVQDKTKWTIQASRHVLHKFP
jgi:uncharacterized membrane protein